MNCVVHMFTCLHRCFVPRSPLSLEFTTLNEELVLEFDDQTRLLIDV